MKYTTIRISVEDKKKLEKMSKILNKSLAETLRYVISYADKEFDKFKGDLDKVLSSLRHAKDIGETNAEDVDGYIYGSAD
jgi:predicted DNA-binding protein